MEKFLPTVFSETWKYGRIVIERENGKRLFWGGFSNGMQQLLNLFFGIFLARLLSPSDYGLVGMLTIFYFDSRLVAGEWFYLGDNQSPGRNVE